MMKKSTKVWFISALSLVLIGVILFVCVMSTLSWDFARLSTVRYETNTHEVSEAFSNITLISDTADIVFVLSDDGKCRVKCYEEESARHSVAVENDVLVISVDNQKAWYDYIGFHFNSPRIAVFLPKAKYDALSINENTGNVVIPRDFSFERADISVATGNVSFFAAARETVKIKTSTGNIRTENNSVGSLDLSVTTGKVMVSGAECGGDISVGVSTGKAYLTDISCKSITSNGTTGSISMNHVIAAEKLFIERSTGDVKFECCDASELYVKTNTGDVIGSLLTDKVFITDTNTGKIDVPETADGGKCEIITGTGDIKVTVG